MGINSGDGGQVNQLLGWATCELNNYVSRITYGFTNPMPSVSDGVYMITANDIKDGKLQLHACRKTTEEAYRSLITNKSRPRKNDVLVTKDGTLGRVALVGDETICINQSVAVIRPNGKINPLFLKFLLESDEYQQTMIENAGGSTIKHIYITVLGKMKVRIPAEIIEQTAIATALFDTDALITSLEKLIAKKRNIKQGAMQRLFAPKKGWRRWRVGELGNVYGGLSGKTKQDFQNGQSRYIPFMNIMANATIDLHDFGLVNIGHRESQNKAVKGDLFFNGSSETPDEVGMCSVLLEEVEDLYLNSFCFGFRPKKEPKADPLYLAYFFRSSEGRKLFYSLAQGATRYNLSKSAFLNLELQLPSYEEQQTTAAIINTIDLELFVIENKISKMMNIKLGMMEVLLKGKIRLI